LALRPQLSGWKYSYFYFWEEQLKIALLSNLNYV